MITENLRILRRKHKLTQQEVADILGIDRSTYTFYETGKTRPAIENIKKLTDIYNVTFGYLCGYERNVPEAKNNYEGEKKVGNNYSDFFCDANKNERFIIMAYRSMDDDKKEEFMEELRSFLKKK